MIISGKTDKGKKRNNNEDSLFYDGSKGIFIVADGMGGHQAGEEASRIAVETISRFLLNQKQNVGEIIEKSIDYSNSIIYSKNELDSKYKGMGTTLTCAVFRNKRLYIGHVGDSRLYQLRNNILNLITDDHSKVWELYKAGLLTLDEARTHPYKSVITRAVGIKPEVNIDLLSIDDLIPGDLYLLCSDGLSDMLSDTEIQNILLMKDRSIEEKVDRLVGSANFNGGKDNISLILIEIEYKDIYDEEKVILKISEKEHILFCKNINFLIKSKVDYY